MKKYDYSEFLFDLMEAMSKVDTMRCNYEDIIYFIKDHYKDKFKEGMFDIETMLANSNFKYSSNDKMQKIEGTIKYVLDVFVLYMAMNYYNFNTNYRYKFNDKMNYGDSILKRCIFESDPSLGAVNAHKDNILWMKNVDVTLMTDKFRLYMVFIFSEAGVSFNPDLHSHVIGIGSNIVMIEKMINGVVHESLRSSISVSKKK